MSTAAAVRLLKRPALQGTPGSFASCREIRPLITTVSIRAASSTSIDPVRTPASAGRGQLGAQEADLVLAVGEDLRRGREDF
jgi:hypothetical protein